MASSCRHSSRIRKKQRVAWHGAGAPDADTSPPSPELRVDDQGKLTIDFCQSELDALLGGTGQNVIAARRDVRTLVIKDLARIPEDWPTLPNLEDLTIKVSRHTLEEFPRVLRSSALPALQRLTLCCDPNNGKWPCPLLEGCFEQLSDVTIDKLTMEMDVIDTVLRPSLTTLRLLRIRHREKEWAHLTQALQEHACPDLTHLDLEKCGIGAEGCERLAQALRQRGCPKLTHLCLERNNIGPAGCAAVIQSLGRGCPNLTHLFLGHNWIYNEGCTYLGWGLRDHACPNLIHLDLRCNCINSSGFMHLARALQKSGNRGTFRARLGLKYFGADDCADVLKTLRCGRCPMLAHLDLRNNQIGDEGCRYLVQALRARALPNLGYLNIEDAFILDQGCLDLAQALQENACPYLTHLILRNNCMRHKGLTALVRGAENCPSIRHLDARCQIACRIPGAALQERSFTLLMK